jgi:hypothetical protein
VIRTLGRGLVLGLFFGLVLEVCFRFLISDVAHALGSSRSWWTLAKADDLTPFFSFGFVFGFLATLLSRRPRLDPDRRSGFGTLTLAGAVRAVASAGLVFGLGELLGALYGQTNAIVHWTAIQESLAIAFASFFVAWVEVAFAREKGLSGDALASVVAVLVVLVGSPLGWAAGIYLETVWTKESLPKALVAFSDALAESVGDPRAHVGLVVPLVTDLVARRRRLSFAAECALVVVSSVVLVGAFPVGVTTTAPPGLAALFFLMPLSCGLGITYVVPIAVPLAAWLGDFVRARVPEVEKASDEPERPPT